MSRLKVDNSSGYFTGTCSVTADDTAAKKIILPSAFKGTSYFVGILNGEDTYLEGGSNWDRQGINFPNTETEANALTTTSINGVMLTETLGVISYIVSTKLYAIAFTLSGGGTPSFGSVATVNDADTGIFPKIIRVNATTYAIAYVDDGGSNYVYVRMGSVSGTTITQGAESASFSATSAAEVDEGIGLCMPRSGVLAVTFSDDDTYGYCAASKFTTITVGTPGTAVEFATASQNSDLSDCCSHADGKIAVAYQDADNSDYLTINIGTVSATAVVAFGG